MSINKETAIALAFFSGGSFTAFLAYQHTPWANAREVAVSGLLRCDSVGIALGTSCRIDGVEFDAPGVFISAAVAAAVGENVEATLLQLWFGSRSLPRGGNPTKSCCRRANGAAIGAVFSSSRWCFQKGRR